VKASASLVLARGVAKAAKDRPSLWLTGMAATGSVVVQSWTLFAVSAAAYTTVIVWNMTRKTFWSDLMRDLRRRPIALPDPAHFTDSVARHFINRMSDARVELKRVLGRTRGELTERLQSRIDLLGHMEERGLLLVRRLEEISRYLADKSPYTLQTDVERLRRATHLATDPRLKAEYNRARVALEEELAALREIMTTRDLVVARLETIGATLEMFPCQVVRLAVLEADDAEEDVSCDPRALLAAPDDLANILRDSDEAFRRATATLPAA
jgi:hypothetical protein